jgi:DNA polymerase III delta prime subunit
MAYRVGFAPAEESRYSALSYPEPTAKHLRNMTNREAINNVKTDLMLLYDDVLLIKEQNIEVLELGQMLVDVSNLKTEIQLIIDELSEILASAMAEETMLNFNDGTIVERRLSTARKTWQHQKLAEVVSERIHRMSVDMDTGEVTLTSRQMMEKMLEFLQPSYWRVGALNSIGVNADNYCEVNEPKETIVIRKAKK